MQLLFLTLTKDSMFEMCQIWRPIVSKVRAGVSCSSRAALPIHSPQQYLIIEQQQRARLSMSSENVCNYKTQLSYWVRRSVTINILIFCNSIQLERIAAGQLQAACSSGLTCLQCFRIILLWTDNYIVIHRVLRCESLITSHIETWN